DCANDPVDGANIVVKRNGSVVTGLTDFDLGAFSAMAAGVHVVFNVAPGTVEVSAKVGTTTLQAHNVDVFMGGSTMTIVRPGYF
ncbi:MAG TPA: hypothetical protein VMZ53_27855, partial [Kofleriaceae bacterium]|nr:hypothetical protein [Kofleriaceae bacterium]